MEFDLFSGEHDEFDANGSDQRLYWSFSWHEIGVFDLPASIDYILNETKSKKLTYIGFSQGTTCLLVLLSMRPEYNNKIIEANFLAPVAFMRNTDNWLYDIIAYFYKPLKRVLEILRIYKFTINNGYLSKIVEIACKKVSEPKSGMCSLISLFISSQQINYVGGF